jgi:T-complex protein 1 subunit beta
MNQGTIGSMWQLGVTESYKLKRQVVISASEAAEMIIRYAMHLLDREPFIDSGVNRVDDILRATPRRREAV